MYVSAGCIIGNNIQYKLYYVCKNVVKQFLDYRN